MGRYFIYYGTLTTAKVITWNIIVEDINHRSVLDEWSVSKLPVSIKAREKEKEVDEEEIVRLVKKERKKEKRKRGTYEAE